MAETQVQTITEDDLSKILHGNVDSVLTPAVEQPEVTNEPKPEPFKKPVTDDFSWKDLEEEAEDEPEVQNQPEPTQAAQTEPEKKKTVKAPSKGEDLVSVVNSLIEEGSLFGYDDDAPVKTADDVKELIKLNIQEVKKSGFEDVWKEKVESFSPQIQAILKYAENGGQDITPLLNAISEVEEVGSYDLESEDGQEGIISEFLKVSGWPEEDIKEEIETAKDLGKLKTKAEKFLPKLNQMHQERIEQMMEEQEEREKINEEARQNYLNTIRNTLNKEKLVDVKLSRQDKALLWDGLTDVKYKSWSGQPTNRFFKRLEEIQAGKSADYDQFLEIVHMTLDPQGFKAKLKEQLKTEGTVETARQLKLNQKRNSNSETLFEEEPTRKPTIKRTGFKNPFA